VNVWDEYADYKAKEKKKDQEIEDRNRKYAEMHKENHRLSEELKKLRLNQESSKRPREDDVSTPTASPSKPPQSQKPRREANPPLASLLPTNPPKKQLFRKTDPREPSAQLQTVECMEVDPQQSIGNVLISDNLSLEVTNGELIAHMSSNGLKYTNPLQKKNLLEYILKKLNVSESQLSKAELAELQKSISKFFSTFCTKYEGSKVSRTLSRLVSEKWYSAKLNLPETIVNRKTVNSFSLQEMDTELQHQEENISFSHNELCTVMKNNLDCDFTDVLKQAQALKEYMLKKLSLDEEEIFECMGEFEEKIKTFVLNTCSKYKKVTECTKG
jgi:hypothetical protein